MGLEGIEGGCFCGVVRFRLEGPPVVADYCHCRMCQHGAGAPVVAWGTWPADRFRWTGERPASFTSSPRGERHFCQRCGTSLTFVDPEDAGQIDVSLAALDDPAAFPPTRHVWTASRIAWLEIADDLPRHAGSARA